MSVLSKFTRIIPPPNYITFPSVGVDISDTSLKYIQFTPDGNSGSKLNLTHWGDISIPKGALERGEIKDQKKLIEALKKAKDICGFQNIRVSLPEEHAYIFETEIKIGTPYKEIRGALEFRLEENVPLSPRDAFFDYDIVEQDDKADVLRVLVTAYNRKKIISYYESCKSAGLTPLSFEVEAQAIARATIPQNDKNTHMIVDFGKMRTGIGIVHKGVLMYTSTIDIGGKDLSTALRSQLGDKTEKEFTHLKNTEGLTKSGGNCEIYDALIATVSAINDEIAKRVQYWDTIDDVSGDRSLEGIILCGGSVNLKGLPEYFSHTLEVPVTRASVWQNAFSLEEFVPDIDRQHSYGYATAIGLALTQFVNTDI